MTFYHPIWLVDLAFVCTGLKHKAQMYLQPNYGNVFFAMFTFQVDNTKKSQVNIPAPHCLNGSCRYVPPQSLWQQCPAKWIAMSWVHFATHTRPADLLLPDDYSDYTRVHDMNDSLLLPANDIMWANVYETNLHKVFYPIV